MNKWIKCLLITLSSLIGLILIVLGVACWLLFSPNRLTPIANRVANNYLDAEVTIEKVDLSYFSTRPFVRLKLKNVLVLDKVSPSDTLTCIPTAIAVLNLNELLFNNNFILTQLELMGSVSNVSTDAEGRMNWDIFPPSSDTAETASTPLDSMFNSVDLKQILITSGRINYHNAQTQQHVAVHNATIRLDGSFIQHKLLSEVALCLQSVAFQQTTPEMSVLFPQMTLNLTSSTNFQDGQIQLHTVLEQVQMSYDNEVYLNKPNLDLTLAAEYSADEQKISIAEGGLLVNDIPFSFNGIILVEGDAYAPHLAFELDTTRYGQIFEQVPKSYAALIPEYVKINDGELFCKGVVTGLYSGHSMPNVDMDFGLRNMDMVVNNSRIDTLNLITKVALRMNDLGASTLAIEDFYYSGHLGRATASADVVGFTDNPHITARVHTDLNLRRLNRLFARESEYQTRGTIHAELHGSFALEDMLNFVAENIKADGVIAIDSLRVYNRADSINIFADFARFRFGSQVDDTTMLQGRALFRGNARLDSMDLNYKGLYTATIGRFSCGYRCEPPTTNAVSTQIARVSFRDLNFRMVKERLRFSTGRTSANLRIEPNPDKLLSPVGSVRVVFDSLFYRYSGMAIRLSSSELNLALKPQQRAESGGGRGRASERDTSAAARQQLRLDRLKEMTSDQFIDELMSYVTGNNDTVDLGEKFLNDFAYEGSLTFDTLRLRAPDFPLPIQVVSTKMNITSRVFTLHNAQMYMGYSDLVVSGTLENFKRAMFNGGTLRGDVHVKSQKVDANQLMWALAYDPATDTVPRRRRGGDTLTNAPSGQTEIAKTPVSTDLSDNEMFTVEQEPTDETSLFIIPKTLNLTLNASIDSLVFGKSTLTNLHGEAEIKDEFLRLNKFKLTNGAGEMNFEMAYKALNLQSAKFWIDLRIAKTDIQNLLKLYPEIDTMMPVTRSLEGLVDCNLTASAWLDSAMNVDLARTKASCNLHGENLVLLDGETFTEISKTLMFRNKERNLVDSISVDMIVDSNRIEIFPFRLSMDRYELAIDGTQHLDMSFEYHITVLHSPVPFKLGIDISGTMDKFRTRVVRPRLRSLSSPVISVEMRDRTLNAQREFKRVLEHEFQEIVKEDN